MSATAAATPCSLRMLRLMANYHCQANRNIIKSVPAPQNAVFPVPIGFGSILATSNHIAFADELWLDRITCGGNDKIDYIYNNTDEKIEDKLWFDLTSGDWEKTSQLLIQNSEALRHYVECEVKSEEMLHEVCEYKSTDGAAKTIPRGFGLMHIFNHGTEHRAQINSSLMYMGFPIPPLDMTYFPGLEL